MAAQKGCTKTGGRRKGTPNKVGADIKVAFRKHGSAFVKALVKLTKSKDENVRVKALQICLDRGYGKAAQHIEAEISIYDSLGLAEKQALLAALESLDVDTADANDEATRH
jgi:hypothetical protein